MLTPLKAGQSKEPETTSDLPCGAQEAHTPLTPGMCIARKLGSKQKQYSVQGSPTWDDDIQEAAFLCHMS